MASFTTVALAGTADAEPAPTVSDDAAHIAGTLTTVHVDAFAASHTAERFAVHGTQGSFTVLDNVPSSAQSLIGDTIAVAGHATDGGAVEVSSISAAPAAGGARTHTAAASKPVTTRRVAVVLLNFSDRPQTPWSVAEADTVMFSGTTSVAAFYSDSSSGAVTFTGSVFGYYTITRTTAGCAFTQWSDAARSAAAAAGVNLSGYHHVVYVWPGVDECGWSGIAAAPGNVAWINGSLTTYVIAHELGHNLGLYHASALQCTDAAGTPAAVSDTCTVSEYGDPFSIMGSSERLHHATHRAQLAFPVVATVATADGTWTVVPPGSQAGSALLRIPRGDGDFLDIEYRQPSGMFDIFAPDSAVATGVTLRIAPALSRAASSKLVDVTPTLPASFDDSSLKPGESFTDPVSGALIHLDMIGDGGASVSVVFPPDTTPPTAVTALRATTAGTAVTLSWQPATDNRAVTGYRISRGSIVRATTGTATHTDTSITRTGVYVYTVVAVDAAGNVGPPAQVNVGITIPDTTAPSPVRNLRATVGARRTVTLAWTAAADNVGVVRYRVTRPGMVKNVTTTSATDRPGVGTFTYRVRAYDAAGNRSAGRLVTVTVR
jgi:hypothetical protein